MTLSRDIHGQEVADLVQVNVRTYQECENGYYLMCIMS